MLYAAYMEVGGQVLSLMLLEYKAEGITLRKKCGMGKVGRQMPARILQKIWV